MCICETAIFWAFPQGVGVPPIRRWGVLAIPTNGTTGVDYMNGKQRNARDAYKGNAEAWGHLRRTGLSRAAKARREEDRQAARHARGTRLRSARPPLPAEPRESESEGRRPRPPARHTAQGAALHADFPNVRQHAPIAPAAPSRNRLTTFQGTSLLLLLLCIPLYQLLLPLQVKH